MEIWKAINGLGEVYEVSSLGRVRSKDKSTMRKDGKILNTKGRILSIQTDHNGYSRIVIFYKGKRNTYKVHRLAADTFIENSENKPNINHKNNLRTDNRIENLEWCTQKENMQHCTKQNRIVAHRGVDHVNAKLTEVCVIKIRELYKSNNYYKAELARMFMVDVSTIASVIKRETWKHI